MLEHQPERPLRPGDRVPNVVLDAITRQGKVAIDDFRGQKAVIVGLYRGLHCPFCRRQIAAMAQLDGALQEKGIDSLTVVHTPIDRARLYFRYHPVPNLLAAADPELISHRAFGLPHVEFTENETDWPRKIGKDVVMAMRVDVPGELPEPMDPLTASSYLHQKDGYDFTDIDQQMMETDQGQLIGQFLLDRDGIVRWSFTEFPDNGRRLLAVPDAEDVMSAASQLAA